jgi:uncharacterized protein
MINVVIMGLGIGVGNLLTVGLEEIILHCFMPFTEKVLDCIITHSSTSSNYDRKKNIQYK